MLSMPNLIRHVIDYANVLFSWQLFEKRAELLKAATVEIDNSLRSWLLGGERQRSYGTYFFFSRRSTHADFLIPGLILRCRNCQGAMPINDAVCRFCSTPNSKPPCTVCRLPVKGKSPHLVVEECKFTKV